ncbi:NUDIX hydrolase [Antribacter gilvus]|uniref:NUDIX hydrolase n=1 Tax=Antribacter gilvus TaxID=2304675 RepID=UPI00197EAF31|nr:NUDIX hydrolase [Antribacter gilvus]
MSDVPVIEAWTGEHATRLQAALRMSNEDFAAHLDVATRTVAGWHANPAITPRPEIQQRLDVALERTSAGERQRFEALARPMSEPPSASDAPHQLYAAIAIVQKGDSVLLVQRRDSASLAWQFPAGIVKPGASADIVAVHETLAETGIHCTVRTKIGARLHPVTGVYCAYFHCDYLAGEAENRDLVENASVTWAPITSLTKFIPEGALYPPILETLGGSHV